MIRNGANFDGNKWPDLAKVLKGTTLPDDRGLFLRGYDPTATKDIDGSTRGFMSYQEGSYLLKAMDSATISFSPYASVLHTNQYLCRDNPDNPGWQISVNWSSGVAQGTRAMDGYVGVSRPKNRNYLPIIYAGPEVQT